ncbi:MAG: hypothetical protein R3E77_06620 [Steroidobacteraceae bacterium]
MKILIAAVMAVALVGCATPYQSSGFRGGYKEIRLGDNVFQVSFQGNAYIGAQKVKDFTLLRSAELAQENGFDYFAIVDSASYQKTGVISTPARTYSSASVVGNSAYGSSTTYGGTVSTYAKPSSSNTIVCFKERPEGFSYSATEVIRSLRAAYRMHSDP